MLDEIPKEQKKKNWFNLNNHDDCIVVETSVPTHFRKELSTKKSKSEKFVKVCLHLKVVQIGLQFGQKCQNSNFARL